MLTGEADGEGNSEHQTPPRSKSTSEPVRDGLGELLESRKVVIGMSGGGPASPASTRGVRASSRIVFMKEFMIGEGDRMSNGCA
jgi:hypothetical protein